MSDQNFDQLDQQTKIHCPKCYSTDWTCYNEATRPCWNQDGERAGTQVIGGLKCKSCNHAWLDYSPDPCHEEEDCWCEEY